jgi:hypothetical protein
MTVARAADLLTVAWAADLCRAASTAIHHVRRPLHICRQSAQGRIAQSQNKSYCVKARLTGTQRPEVTDTIYRSIRRHPNRRLHILGI